MFWTEWQQALPEINLLFNFHMNQILILLLSFQEDKL
jgi:hypothetical protein